MTSVSTPESRGDKDAYLAARYAEDYVKSLTSHERTLKAAHSKNYDRSGRVKHTLAVEWLEVVVDAA